MHELLAIPSSLARPATLADWTRTLAELGHEPRIAREDGMTWVEVPALRLRGVAVFEGANVEAINFEMSGPDPSVATALLQEAARSLDWELHDDDDDDDNEDDD